MRRVQKVGVALFVSLCIALLADVAQADQICLSIVGEKIKFNDEMPPVKGCEGKIAGLSFQYGVALSIVPGPTGGALVVTGQRTDKPVRVKKVWGAARLNYFML